jgi:hypothetical protein
MNAESEEQNRNYAISSREYADLKSIKSNNMTGVGNPMFGLKGKDHPRFGMTGSLNGKYGKPGPCRGLTGSLHPSFGKLTGSNNGMYGRSGALSPQFGVTGSANPNSKPVSRYEMGTGVLLESYQSATEAMSITKVDATSIARVCKGTQKQAGGFHWKYAEL